MEWRRIEGRPIEYVEFAYKQKEGYEMNWNANRHDGETNSHKREPW
jgi:hypothetical protein